MQSGRLRTDRGKGPASCPGDVSMKRIAGELKVEPRQILSPFLLFSSRLALTLLRQVRRRLGLAKQKQAFVLHGSRLALTLLRQVRRRLGLAKQKQAFVLQGTRLALTLPAERKKKELWCSTTFGLHSLPSPSSSPSSSSCASAIPRCFRPS